MLHVQGNDDGGAAESAELRQRVKELQASADRVTRLERVLICLQQKQCLYPATVDAQPTVVCMHNACDNMR